MDVCIVRWPPTSTCHTTDIRTRRSRNSRMRTTYDNEIETCSRCLHCVCDVSVWPSVDRSYDCSCCLCILAHRCLSITSSLRLCSAFRCLLSLCWCRTMWKINAFKMRANVVGFRLWHGLNVFVCQLVQLCYEQGTMILFYIRWFTWTIRTNPDKISALTQVIGDGIRRMQPHCTNSLHNACATHSRFFPITAHNTFRARTSIDHNRGTYTPCVFALFLWLLCCVVFANMFVQLYRNIVDAMTNA